MLADRNTIAKVTALVVSDDRRLLVFRHPLGGCQLPAGTVEAGETPDAAVVREVHEETGYRVRTPPVALSTDALACSRGERVLLATPSDVDPVPDRAVAMRRGVRVYIDPDSPADPIHVEARTWDLTVSPPRVLERHEGRVPRAGAGEVLADTVERTFFRIEAPADTVTPLAPVSTDDWTFEPGWLSIADAAAALVDGHRRWLERFRERL